MINNWSLRELALLYTGVTASVCLFYGNRISETHPRLSATATTLGVVLALIVFSVLLSFYRVL